MCRDDVTTSADVCVSGRLSRRVDATTTFPSASFADLSFFCAEMESTDWQSLEGRWTWVTRGEALPDTGYGFTVVTDAAALACGDGHRSRGGTDTRRHSTSRGTRDREGRAAVYRC